MLEITYSIIIIIIIILKLWWLLGVMPFLKAVRSKCIFLYRILCITSEYVIVPDRHTYMSWVLSEITIREHIPIILQFKESECYRAKQYIFVSCSCVKMVPHYGFFKYPHEGNTDSLYIHSVIYQIKVKRSHLNHWRGIKNDLLWTNFIYIYFIHIVNAPGLSEVDVVYIFIHVLCYKASRYPRLCMSHTVT